MTIGIAVSGPMAGLAVFRALRAVESVSRGAIGGFVSFAAISADGLVRAETQRGGTRTLFTQGETTGTEPPAGVAEATLAVLMSSGPDRPTPLSQFTPGNAAVGLVTGHRLPNVPVPGGRPANEEVLAMMAAGADPDAAAALLDAHPRADAGVIALARDGRMAFRNTARVNRRDDIGSALVTDPASGLTVGVIHNAIFPVAPLAMLAVAAAIDTVAPADRWDCEVLLEAGLPLGVAEEPAILVEDGVVTAITVDEPAWLGPRWDGAAIPRGCPVTEAGRILGRIAFEPYCVAREGRLVSMSGFPAIRLGVRR